jgi:hypothetical protein
MAPDAFFADGKLDDLATLTADIKQVHAALDEGRDVFLPEYSLGTGLLELPLRAPASTRFCSTISCAVPLRLVLLLTPTDPTLDHWDRFPVYCFLSTVSIRKSADRARRPGTTARAIRSGRLVIGS